MRKEFLVERQGKSFCLYAGLLDLATQQGLKSIRTELIQAPTEGNQRIAICTATVTLEKDGMERTFTGLGDAAPNNVAPAMQTCLLRMAETRAKARALRDAVNIGMCSIEELPGDSETRDPELATRNPSARSIARTAAAGDRIINTGGGPCPDCHAPAGKAHASKCTAERAAA